MKTKVKTIAKKIIITSVLGLGLSSMQVQALSNQGVLDIGNSVEPSALMTLFDRATDFISSKNTTTNAQLPTTSKSPFHTQRNQSQVTLQRTVGGSGMFRRVVNAPRAGGRLNPTNKLKPSVKRGQLSLSVNTPAGTDLQSKDYEWVIRSKKLSIRKKGKNAKVLLPRGKYTVRLTVGNTVRTKSVTIAGNNKKLPFSISTGSLRASVSFAGGKSVKASWEVYKLKSNGKRGGKVYSAKSATGIKRALAPGKYQVVAKVGRVVEKKIITVSAGKTKRTTVRLSGSKVKLLATKSDKKSPLFKKTQWVIKNAANNRTVLTKNRHSATVTLPPGKYVATAISGNIKRKQKFVVKPGRNNRVLVAME